MEVFIDGWHAATIFAVGPTTGSGEEENGVDQGIPTGGASIGGIDDGNLFRPFVFSKIASMSTWNYLYIWDRASKRRVLQHPGMRRERASNWRTSDSGAALGSSSSMSTLSRKVADRDQFRRGLPHSLRLPSTRCLSRLKSTSGIVLCTSLHLVVYFLQ